MDPTTIFDFSFLGELLSDSGKASLTEKLLVVGAVWIVMGKKVTRHFNSLEQGMTTGFQNLTKSVNEVKEALREVEMNHEVKISQLMLRVDRLEDSQKASETRAR